MRLKTGMSVRVISGNHKGKEGKILRVIKDTERVIIEGVNLIKKHTRPTQENPKGGIIEREGSLHIYNICLLYTYEYADDLLCVDICGLSIIKKK